ncbi:MAG: TlpA disulfide reductase family protein [Saprospiraceae bacterium]|nr:TlpA disulfide reductase family protein [Saprospiraceae bacterium]
MKKTLLLMAAIFAVTTIFAQKTLPSANIKTLEGQSINVQELGKTGKITVINFWATWCSPCKKELDAIMDYYEDWQKDYDMELIAISVDDARSAAKVPGMVKEKASTYRVLLDPAKELQTAANIQAVPYTFVLDQNGNIVFEHNGYTPGDELELEELFKELKKKG